MSERIDAHPGGRGGWPTYEVAAPFWVAIPAQFAQACIIDGVELPINHLELFEGGWGGDSTVPPMAWYDIGMENVSAFNFDLSFAVMGTDEDGGTLTHMFDKGLAGSDSRVRLAPAWDLGLWPSCQLWLINKNPSGRSFWIESYGCRIEWKDNILTLSSRTTGKTVTYDMGKPPEPCFVRLYVSGGGEPYASGNLKGKSPSEGCHASVWSLEDAEPKKFMLNLSHPHAWLNSPHILIEFFVWLIIWRSIGEDWTYSSNEGAVIGVSPPEEGETLEPIGISSMVLEQGKGSVDLCAYPPIDITEQPWRTCVNYYYDRPAENCWWLNWYPIEQQHYASYGGPIMPGDRDEWTWLFGWWGGYKDYFLPLPGGGGGGHLYDPYIRADDGWWIWWSPCIFGGYAPGYKDTSGWVHTIIGDFWIDSSTHYDDDHVSQVHAMWKDSAFITLAIPSKYVTGFDFDLTLGLRTHQDFSIILGMPEGPFADYRVGLWCWSTDDPDLWAEDIVDGLPAPSHRQFVGEASANGGHIRGSVKFDKDPKKRKRFLRYGLEWIGDTLAQAQAFGPRGGPLFGPPWVRAVCMPIHRSIVMHWDATSPEEGVDGSIVTPEETVMLAPRQPISVDDPENPGEKMLIEFHQEHGWCEEVLPLKAVTLPVTTNVWIPLANVVWAPEQPPVVVDGQVKVAKAMPTKRRYFRLTRGYRPGFITVYASGKKLMYGIGDPDAFNKEWSKEIAKGKVKKQIHDFWIVDRDKETPPWDDDWEPRTFCLRSGIRATCLTVHYLTVEFPVPQGDPVQRKSDAPATRTDRLKRGMYRGYT